MRKFFVIAIIAVLFGFIGCDNGTTPPKDFDPPSGSWSNVEGTFITFSGSPDGGTIIINGEFDGIPEEREYSYSSRTLHEKNRFVFWLDDEPILFIEMNNNIEFQILDWNMYIPGSTIFTRQ
jgi:hypothetical protein